MSAVDVDLLIVGAGPVGLFGAFHGVVKTSAGTEVSTGAIVITGGIGTFTPRPLPADGKVRLIAVGFGEVATAVNNAAVHIDPAAQLFPGHSTDNPASVPVPA